jgi:hypothetical protein
LICKVAPRFHWDIGAPAETKPKVKVVENLSKHTKPNATCGRRFQKGAVLINPDWAVTNEIDLAVA